MVATLAQMASAAYYLESQRSFRHPNEYYTAGEEPDGVWWNPCGLFGIADGGRVDGGEFYRLYHGFAPGDGERLTRNAGSEKRSPGLDMTFSADKSVSALWAIADPELRSELERVHNDAARAALAETVLRYCAWTRLQERDGTRVVAADIMGAMFQHGTSRENDPQLHTHCTIFNAARTHRDGKYRALHQHPVYAWMKAAGAVYRNALAWNLRHRLGIRMEQYGRDMAAGMTADTGHSLPTQAVGSKVAGLLKAGYPLSEEQIAAIRTVTSSGGQVAIIEGAAGSGKTTTLRPIADLYREHGSDIIATAVAWRTAVALGNDVEARPFCVDKLLRLAARGGIEITKDTTIIVDEAGMLSTRQAHHILQLSERHGAKIVFAGDTQQQQPVEAGPGLRLIRDAVGSVRVDRIRRQKADLEDILTHVQGETPETARRLASSMAEERRSRILTYYENMKGKIAFTPWQVATSEALRDLAASLAGQREGEDIRMREQRIARLLNDPEKLQELRQQRAERKAEKSERQQQSKGRYWSMRI